MSDGRAVLDLGVGEKENGPQLPWTVNTPAWGAGRAQWRARLCLEGHGWPAKEGSCACWSGPSSLAGELSEESSPAVPFLATFGWLRPVLDAGSAAGDAAAPP